MKRSLLFAFASCAILGCGGGGGSSSGSIQPGTPTNGSGGSNGGSGGGTVFVSPFPGSYAGTFTSKKFDLMVVDGMDLGPGPSGSATVDINSGGYTTLKTTNGPTGHFDVLATGTLGGDGWGTFRYLQRTLAKVLSTAGVAKLDGTTLTFTYTYYNSAEKQDGYLVTVVAAKTSPSAP